MFQNSQIYSFFCIVKSFKLHLFRSARTSWITFVRPPVRPSVGKKNLDQLYSSINRQRTTANLSDIVWWCLEHVWWCLVVSGGV